MLDGELGGVVRVVGWLSYYTDPRELAFTYGVAAAGGVYQNYYIASNVTHPHNTALALLSPRSVLTASPTCFPCS